MSEALITQIVFYYYAIGFIVTILLDYSIRVTGSSEPFTFREFIMTVLLWPAAVYSFLVRFFN